MNPAEIIKLKRDGRSLTKEQLEFFISCYLKGKLPDYQMSAFLMAVYFKGLNEQETFYLTDIMFRSGKIVDLKFLKKPKIDKHSTGGVGDKTSLILAPLAATFGIAVPMISGRGLGHTGGTLDKLESIPGFKVNYSIQDYKKIISKAGLVMNGQTSELAPADKKIYALRDVTATVPNISLITASIMSKKLAEGADGIVFDVKIGSGANLPDKDESVMLAKQLISVSKKFGKKAIAVLTDMNEPLGYKIGNWLEVEECIEVMNDKFIPDLVTVNNILTGAMLYLGGKAKNLDEGEKLAYENLHNGKAFGKFLEMVKIQSGDIKYINDWFNLKRTKYSKKIISKSAGFINEMNAYKIGMASVELGCGRKKVDDNIDELAGIILYKKCGDKIKKGETVCELFASDKKKINEAENILREGFKISEKPVKKRKLIIDILN
jgi:pyrimidine-nucleoside phosphorylase